MPKAARFNDICTGHECFPPRKNIQASEDVFINLRGAHRQGDAWEVHCCTHPDEPHGCHSSVLASGSSSVYINGKQAGRIDDPIACGGRVATGSDDVIIGG